MTGQKEWQHHLVRVTVFYHLNIQLTVYSFIVPPKPAELPAVPGSIPPPPKPSTDTPGPLPPKPIVGASDGPSLPPKPPVEDLKGAPEIPEKKMEEKETEEEEDDDHLDERGKKLKKRHKVVQEMIATEQTYIIALQIMVDVS